jgi:hypothetical protein
MERGGGGEEGLVVFFGDGACGVVWLLLSFCKTRISFCAGGGGLGLPRSFRPPRPPPPILCGPARETDSGKKKCVAPTPPLSARASLFPPTAPPPPPSLILFAPLFFTTRVRDIAVMVRSWGQEGGREGGGQQQEEAGCRGAGCGENSAWACVLGEGNSGGRGENWGVRVYKGGGDRDQRRVRRARALARMLNTLRARRL